MPYLISYINQHIMIHFGELVQSADIHTFITVQMEQKLHELVGDLADISMLKGTDCKEYEMQHCCWRF